MIAWSGGGGRPAALAAGATLPPFSKGRPMYRSNESKVQFAAMTLGMRAQFDDAGRVMPNHVDELVFMAREMLEDGNPTRVLVEGAAKEFALVWRDVQGRGDWGQKLRDDALRIGRPDPVDAHRRDIHG